MLIILSKALLFSRRVSQHLIVSNCATKYDANYKIPYCTEHIDNGNKNTFLLYTGTNTNMSWYIHNLYEYDETENENELKIYEALHLQMPMNMKYENMKIEAQNENENKI